MNTTGLSLLLCGSVLLSACSGGGGENAATVAPPAVPTATQPPAPAGLIWRQDTRLVRSQTDGSGQITLAEEPAEISSVIVSGTQIVYMTQQVPPVTNHFDLWAVHTNGTDRHRLVHDPEHATYLHDVIGSWVLYTDKPGQAGSPPPPSLASIMLDGTASRILIAAEGEGDLWQAPGYQRQAGGHALVGFAGNLFSLLPDGTDLRQLTFYPPYPHFNESFTVLLGIRGVVGEKVIYPTVLSPSSTTSPEGTPKLFAVSILGGPVVKLGTGPEYEILGAVINSRIVYHRCVLVRVNDPAGGFTEVIDQCDVSSVLSDGQGRVALTATQDINYVQGAMGEQVIIRRSQRGGTTDSLFSIPVTGGVETPLLSLSASSEFVSAIVGDRVVLHRPSGLWSFTVDGGLVQLTSDGSDWFTGSTGPFACFMRSEALWCVPADGSGPATQVTANGFFVAGL